MVLSLDILENIFKYKQISEIKEKLDKYYIYIYFDTNSYIYEEDLCLGVVKVGNKDRECLLYKIFEDNCEKKYSGIVDDVLYFQADINKVDRKRIRKILEKYLYTGAVNMEELICEYLNSKEKVKIAKKYYTRDEIINVMNELISEECLIIEKLTDIKKN